MENCISDNYLQIFQETKNYFMYNISCVFRNKINDKILLKDTFTKFLIF